MRETDRREDGGEASVRLGLFVPPDLFWIEGHFPEQPILAAVVQVREAALHARECWPDLGSLSNVKRAKFRKPILPADAVRLQLRRRAGSLLVTFEFVRDDEVCSSGSLDFG